MTLEKMEKSIDSLEYGADLANHRGECDARITAFNTAFALLLDVYNTLRDIRSEVTTTDAISKRAVTKL